MNSIVVPSSLYFSAQGHSGAARGASAGVTILPARRSVDAALLPARHSVDAALLLTRRFCRRGA